MAFRLGPAAAEQGFRLAAYESIGSTSAEALERAGAGDPGRLWVVSACQTAGRGRRGRRWETQPGNLAATLLLVDVPAMRIATLGFAAGLAVDAAIRACAPGLSIRVAVDAVDAPSGSRLRLKWPNDVLVDGAKIAGILLEARAGAGGAGALAVGIGVNVHQAPRDTPYPATSLSACGANLSAEDLFAALSDAWLEQERVWDEGRGFPAIRDRWLRHAAGLGAPVAVRHDDEILSGTFETIDEEGRLVVRAADGSARKISAGDVHFGATATVTG